MKEKIKLKFSLNFNNCYIKDLGRMALPLIFGISISQINVLVDKTIASRIAIGGISALNYADRINSFVLSTVVMSISVVIYPMLSKSLADTRINDFKRTLSESIIAISVILVPATIGSMIFATPIINLLLARGAFDAQAISLTSSALLFYCLGMLGIGLREVLSRAFYSMQETKIPVKNAAVGMILNIILNIILSRYFGIKGLALATSISATFTTVLLFISLRKKIGSFGMKNITISFIKILCVSLVMGLIAKTSYNTLLNSIGANLSLLLSIVIGALTYFAIIYFMKIEEVDVIVNALRRKFKKVV